MRRQALTVVLVLIIGSGFITGCGRAPTSAGRLVVKAVTKLVVKAAIRNMNISDEPHRARASRLEASQWILWMYLVPGMGVLGMLAGALLRDYEPERDHASLSAEDSVGSEGPEDSEGSEDWFVLMDHDSREPSDIIETEKPEVEPIELVIPKSSVAESAIGEDPFEGGILGFLSLFSD
jgi:hypothetical protein